MTWALTLDAVAVLLAANPINIGDSSEPSPCAGSVFSGQSFGTGQD